MTRRRPAARGNDLTLLHNNQSPCKRQGKENITKWKTHTCPELRNELQERGLSQKGKKEELTRRLQRSERQEREVDRHNPRRFQTCEQLRNECQRRGLSPTPRERKQALIDQLEFLDEKDFLAREKRKAREKKAAHIAPMSAKFSEVLPIELRLMIWELTLPGPRAIPIDIEPRFDLIFPPCGTRSKNPIALSICHESREHALRSYQTVLGWEDVYASYDRGDYLYLGNWWDGGVAERMGLSTAFWGWKISSPRREQQLSLRGQVKSIALGYKLWSNMVRTWPKCFTLALGAFENLQSVALVVQEECAPVSFGYENDTKFFITDRWVDGDEGVDTDLVMLAKRMIDAETTRELKMTFVKVKCAGGVELFD